MTKRQQAILDFIRNRQAKSLPLPTISIGLALGLILGLLTGFFIGGVTVIKSLEQNGYYFRRVNDHWVMWYRHPDTEQLVKHEGYSGDDDPTI